MKRAAYIFFPFFMLLASQLSAQKKHALIIAIGNYPENNGWPVLSSNRDNQYIRVALSRQGFQDNDMYTISDAQATPEGIAGALQRLSGQVNKGDVVVIHVSSHGVQIEDDGYDEPDGLDEAIATYQAIAPKKSKNFQSDQAQYFRDDQFGSFINKLRLKLGKEGDLLVFLDLCHSGTATRGYGTIRGGQPPLVSPTFRKNRFASVDTLGYFMESFSPADENLRSPYVVISAARADQADMQATDDQDEPIGSLTYAACKALENLDEGTTYRSFFSKIVTTVNAKIGQIQDPVMEGNGSDRVLLGGRFVQQKPYIEVQKLNGKELTLKCGKLIGLDIGAIVGIFPPGTTDPLNNKPLAKGKIVEADNYTSRVQLYSDPGTQTSSAWAFLLEPVYGVKPVTIRFSAPESMKEYLASMDGLPLTFTGSKPELYIEKGEVTDSIFIASNGYLFDTFRNDQPAMLREKLKRYIQYKFLSALDVKDADNKVELQLVPWVNGKFDFTKISSREKLGMMEFYPGDTLGVCIKNNGTRTVYVNVLDLQPDGVINAVLPNKEKQIYPWDLKILPGSTHLYSSFFIAPPFGTEILKVFVSRSEMNMEELVVRKGQFTRGSISFPEQLFSNSFSVSGRGNQTINGLSTEGSVYSFLFRISARKEGK